MAKQVILKKGKESPLLRRHPWVFSGAIAKTVGSPKDGDFVQVVSSEGKMLGAGFMGSQSIAVKMIGFGEVIETPFALLSHQLKHAIELRKSLGLISNDSTDAFRLVNGEGDALPGLIIDIYAKTAVIQCHSLGMYLHREKIATLLVELLSPLIETVFDKSAETLQEAAVADHYLIGSATGECIIKENDLQFAVNWQEGQKTGFFLDQRENRARIGELSSGKRVLNTFAYSGGFSLYALRGGASEVVSADISAHACSLADQNAELNELSSRHRTIKADCLDYLAKMEESYDMIILDPPAFAKHRDGVQGALRGYRAINRAAFKKISPGGFISTFSCSQLISAVDFESVVLSAAIEAGRPAKVIYRLTQAPCHPTNLFHPEGSYLKGLIIEVQ